MVKRASTSLPVELLGRMASVLRLLAHPRRLQVIELLERRKEAPVHAVMAHLGLPQAVTSHHLNQMKRVGLVQAERRGKEVWYRIADPRSLIILECIRKKA